MLPSRKLGTFISCDDEGAPIRAGRITVADLVAANGWSDGGDHLIIPGDVIKLPQGTSAAPAKAVTTTKSADTGSASASAGGNTSASGAATASVCTGGEFGDDTVILEGETLAAVAARVGRTGDELQRTNQFGTNGRPAFGSSDLVVVPCVENWPRNTTFYELIGITLDRLQAVNNVDLATIQAGDQVGVCQSWFE